LIRHFKSKFKTEKPGLQVAQNRFFGFWFFGFWFLVFFGFEKKTRLPGFSVSAKTVGPYFLPFLGWT